MQQNDFSSSVKEADAAFRIIAAEFAKSASRVQSAWAELVSAKSHDVALDRVVELQILLSTTARIEREDLAEYVQRIYDSLD